MPPTGKRCPYAIQTEGQEEPSVEHGDGVEQEDGVESVVSTESGEEIEQPQTTEQSQPEIQNEILAAILELKSQMSLVFVRMDGYERGDTGKDKPSDPENPHGSDLELIQPQDMGAAQAATSDPLFRNVQIMARAADQPSDNGANQEVTPDSLHRNVQIMARAAERLAQFGASQIATNENLDIHFGRGQGKKSGSQLLASEAIQARIDWPHFYARRMSAGRRKPVHYYDMKPEEFAHGFLAMINAPKSVFDREIMLRLLEDLMQDATDFGWDNARDFYEMLGVDVERGQLRWEDANTIHMLRMTYCRTVFPEKRTGKEGQKGQSRAAPPGTRCCASYQRKTCDQQRDHPPFTHACSYCLRTCSAVFRHPEDECLRKASDETKNAKGRE